MLRRLVDVLIARQTVQRPTLARETNLSLQVIADLLAELESRGLVLVNGRFTGMPGRSNLTYALADEAAAALTVHVGENWIEAALCNLRGAMVASERSRLQPPDTAIAGQIDVAVRLACQQAGIERFRLGAACVLLEGFDEYLAEVQIELAMLLGCPVNLDAEVDRTASERLGLAHRGLLVALFGEASG